MTEALTECAALAEDAEQLALRVLEYVGDDDIDEGDFLDADREMQVMARAMLARLGKRLAKVQRE